LLVGLSQQPIGLGEAIPGQGMFNLTNGIFIELPGAVLLVQIGEGALFIVSEKDPPALLGFWRVVANDDGTDGIATASMPAYR